MHTDMPDNLADDGLDALVDKLNARYQRVALAAEAAHADYLSVAGGRLTMRKRPTYSRQCNATLALLVDQV